jgi:hypothetical protein
LPDALRQQVIQGWQTSQGEADRVTELENQLKVADDKVAEMEKLVAETKRAAFNATLDNLIAETVKIADLRPVVKRAVLAELAGETGEDKAKEALKEYTEGEEYKGLAQAMSMKLQGGHAIVQGVDNGGIDRLAEFKDTPEARQAARSRTGI